MRSIGREAERAAVRCPSKSQDENERLRALDEYGLSAAVGLPVLDPIVEMAARMFRCPVAAVNLIGHEHVFLVSKHGIDDYDERRDVSFCAHAINQDEVMVIEDAALDPRFHDNPLVSQGLIKFYAGAPLRSPSGHALGALCIIDDQARARLSVEELRQFKELAALATDRLELRRLEIASSAGARRLEASAATSPNAVICFDSDARITAWNDAAAAMFGLSRKDAVGQAVDQLIAEEDRGTVHAAIERVLAGGTPTSEGTVLTGIRSDGERFSAELHWSRWLENDGMHFGAIVRDMTDRKREHDALYQLANMLYQRNDAFRASAFMQRYDALGQASPQALKLGFDIETRLGDKDAALNYRRRLQSQFPESEQARALDITASP